MYITYVGTLCRCYIHYIHRDCTNHHAYKTNSGTIQTIQLIIYVQTIKNMNKASIPESGLFRIPLKSGRNSNKLVNHEHFTDEWKHVFERNFIQTDKIIVFTKILHSNRGPGSWICWKSDSYSARIFFKINRLSNFYSFVWKVSSTLPRTIETRSRGRITNNYKSKTNYTTQQN